MSSKFPSGHMLATPGVINEIPNDEIIKALDRHFSGDWGNVDAHDRAANEAALVEGTRLFSVYESIAGTKFWIITEADRSSTTVLLPSEY